MTGIREIKHWTSAIFCMESKFGPMQMIKRPITIEIRFFGGTGSYTLLDHKRN
jgi:hypothetical protein